MVELRQNSVLSRRAQKTHVMHRLQPLWIALFLTVFLAGAAEATNLSTGEPCNLGIFDAADKQEIFRNRVLPPTVILIVSAMVGLLAHREMKKPENADRRRMMGVVSGISLAVFVTSMSFVGLIFFLDAFAPSWLY